MAEASIPVDLLNPGQVFACLGFLEAAETLLGDARGVFDWTNEADIRFRLSADGRESPIEFVLSTLACADVVEVEPKEWPGEHDIRAIVTGVFPCRLRDHFVDNKWTRTKLPTRIRCGNGEIVRNIDLNGWSDGSSRADFKLYSGNRTGASITRDMLSGKRGKPRKCFPDGKLETHGLRQLWEADRKTLIHDPFGVTCALGGNFNMDPRGAWTAIDEGFSPNEHKSMRVVASPVVEIMAVIGLEHARPDEYDVRRVRYAVWNTALRPMLARAALAGNGIGIPLRSFRFTLELSGKNKVVTFSDPEKL